MSRTKTFRAIDFNSIKPEHVQQLIKDLYKGYPGEKRDFQLDLTKDRRQTDRRQGNKFVLLDTRTCRSRRLSSGRRNHDKNHNNEHKVGIDSYV